MEPYAQAARNGFLLTYDLIKEKNYPRLIDELKRLEWQPELWSVWMLPRTKSEGLTVLKLLDHFRKFVDGDDEFIIIEIADIAPWLNGKNRDARFKSLEPPA